MPEEKFFADSAAEVDLNRDKVQALMDRAERDVKEGVLPACQVAIARNGKLAAMKTFGRAIQGGVEKPATDETVFVAMSATKAITSSALWLLIRQGIDDYRASADSHCRYPDCAGLVQGLGRSQAAPRAVRAVASGEHARREV